MNIRRGSGQTEYGPGVLVELTGDEVEHAINAYLVAQGIQVHGPRTVTVNGVLCKSGSVYVDPCGKVTIDGSKLGEEVTKELPKTTKNTEYKLTLPDGDSRSAKVVFSSELDGVVDLSIEIIDTKPDRYFELKAGSRRDYAVYAAKLRTVEPDDTDEEYYETIWRIDIVRKDTSPMSISFEIQTPYGRYPTPVEMAELLFSEITPELAIALAQRKADSFKRLPNEN